MPVHARAACAMEPIAAAAIHTGVVTTRQTNTARGPCLRLRTTAWSRLAPLPLSGLAWCPRACVFAGVGFSYCEAPWDQRQSRRGGRGELAGRSRPTRDRPLSNTRHGFDVLKRKQNTLCSMICMPAVHFICCKVVARVSRPPRAVLKYPRRREAPSWPPRSIRGPVPPLVFEAPSHRWYVTRT